jgi:hypothetical protein
MPTRRRIACVCLAGALGAFACINLFASFTPVRDHNVAITQRFIASLSAPQPDQWKTLLTEQTALLASEPAEPFAWARLAYLRRTVENDNRTAFAALRMSDLVSSHQPRQMLERAMMWHELRGVQNVQERGYQAVLWARAFRQDREATLAAARSAWAIRDVRNAVKAYREP